MHSYDKRSRLLAIGLSCLAGYVDALGFLSLGGFFISFMSGNSTRFAAGMASDIPWSLALLPLGIIGLFVTGVVVGRVIVHFSDKCPSTNVLLFVTLTLATAGVAQEAGHMIVAASFMAVAMGASNNVFTREGEVSIAVTYMTGTLVKFGQRLASALLGDRNTHWLSYMALWMGLVAGAVLGAFSYRFLGLHSLWVAAAGAAGLTITAVRVDRDERKRGRESAVR